MTLHFKDAEAAASVANAVRNGLRRVRATEMFSTKIKLTDGDKCVQFPGEDAVLSTMRAVLKRSSAVRAFKDVHGCNKSELGL